MAPLTVPAGTVQTFRPNSNNPYGVPWTNVSRWEPWFSEAAVESNVPAQLIAAMAIVESDANQTWPSGPNQGQIIEVWDNFPQDGPSVGIMQVKPQLWGNILPGADAYTPQGNIRLGARLMRNFINARGSWEEAIKQDYHPGTSPQGTTPQDYVDTINSLMAELGSTETPHAVAAETTVVFGNVPHPPFQDRLINNPNGSLNQGSPRDIVGTCVHRMDGTLMGTDGFFRNDLPEALTDYGIGGALDGDLDGVIFRWVDPTGPIVPFASGPFDGPEGDGPAFVNAYGASAINSRLVSIELSGCSGRPDASPGCQGLPETQVTAAQFESLCQLIAYWHDQAQVPSGQFPVNPATGVVTQMQHYEFAQKACPFPIVRGLTTAYQTRVKEIMSAAQSQAGVGVGFPFQAFPAASPVRVFTVVAGGIATGRSEPKTSATPMADFPSGSAIEMDGFFIGESVQGENRWLRTSAQPHLAVHASGLVEPI